ncbi:hypothetical protein [Streptomyces sp. NPDC093991]|uniref:hypothetical protein n=1 Tax=unclassified Streptomyces TaxID=2593676 RepID=UPI00343D7EAB
MRALPARRIALGALCAALLVTTTGPAALAADSHPGQDPAASLAARLPQADTARADLSPVADLVRAVLAAPDGRLPAAEARELADAAREAVRRAAADDPASTSVTVITDSSAPVVPALPGAPVPVTGVLLPAAEEDDGGADSALGAVREALDALLDLLLPASAPADAGSTPTGTTETTEPSGTSTTESDATDTTGTTGGTSATETTDRPADAAGASETAVGAAADAALTSTDALLARVDELLAALAGAEPQTATTLPAPAGPAAPAAPAEPAVSPGLFPALTSLLMPNS